MLRCAFVPGMTTEWPALFTQCQLKSSKKALKALCNNKGYVPKQPFLMLNGGWINTKSVRLKFWCQYIEIWDNVRCLKSTVFSPKKIKLRNLVRSMLFNGLKTHVQSVITSLYAWGIFFCLQVAQWIDTVSWKNNEQIRRQRKPIQVGHG